MQGIYGQGRSGYLQPLVIKAVKALPGGLWKALSVRRVKINEKNSIVILFSIWL
jgi:hypothetical protein